MVGCSLGFSLLLHDLFLSQLLVKLARHEVLVCVQVFIQVNDFLERYLVWPSLHRLLGEPLGGRLVCARNHIYST